MEDSDDFNYDSVVSDPGAYSKILNGDAPEKLSAPEDNSKLGNTILTPSTHMVAHTNYAAETASMPSDSMPSLAVSTPTSERFQLEYDREMRDHGHFDSQQSQFGLKSGMYLNGSDTDISAKLKGDVVFSGKWSAVGDSNIRTHGRRASHSAIDDTTFDNPSFNDSTDVSLSRLIRESSVDDDQKRTMLQSQYASGSDQHYTDRHPPSAPTTPVMRQNTVDGLVTPKMARALSDGSVLHSAPGDARVLRSALRGSRSTGPPPGKVQFDEASLGILHKGVENGMLSTSSLGISSTGLDGASTESIEFGPPQTQDSIGDMDTQPLETDDSADAPASSANEPEDEYQKAVPAEPAMRPRVSSLEGFTGVGMAGGMFRKFAGWTRNHIGQRPLSPALAAATLASPVDPAEAEKPNTTIDSLSSSQSASTVSPVRTEPMHSQMLSNFTTPTSSRSTTSQSTPRQRPGSAKKNALTPSRSVNPLTRHLALKSIRSAPSAQRSMQHGGDDNDASPTNRGYTDMRPLIDSLDASEDSAMLGMSELQQQFDGFADRLKHDASAVHADVAESEEAWTALQNELQTVQMQLQQAETARDFLQQRVEGADRDRVEWEQERDLLQVEKHDLQESVDQWRKRIGDAEKERQGMWTEDMQTREQLLSAIAHLEEQLRDDKLKWNEERADMTHEIDEILLDYDRVETENARIKAKNDQLEGEFGVLDSETRQMQADFELVVSENQQLQADMHELHTRVERERTAVHVKQSNLERERDELRAMAAAHAQERAELQARVAKQQSDNTLLRETLEDLTERNRELKQSRNESNQDLKESRDESNFFTTAINETMLPPSPETDPVENKPAKDDANALLKKELQRMKDDYDMLLGSLREAVEGKNEYKQRAAEHATAVDAFRKQVADLEAKIKQTPRSNDTELEQLRESELQLQKELDRSESMREATAERLRAQEERAHGLSVRCDEQVQRVARLETELSDLQMRQGEDETQKKDSAMWETMVADLTQQITRLQSEGDELRQRLQVADEAQDEMTRARERIAALEASNKQLGSQIVGLHVQNVGQSQSDSKQSQGETKTGETKNGETTTDQAKTGVTKTSSTPISPELQQNVLESTVKGLEENLEQLRYRRTMVEKERRLLADGLRDMLLKNATLRTEISELLLRRMGKLREKQALQRSESHGSDGDDGGASMMSGLLNHVPTTSQLLDVNSKYVHSLDRHLDEVANIIEDDVAMPLPAKRTTASHVFAERTQKRMLTPIREETVSRGRMLQDAATQCSLDGVEDEQRAQRAALADVEQERDQFRAAHEESVEHVTRLAEQIEELSEDHERMRAERTTLARSALCVGRQLDVLRGALARLASRSSSASSTAPDADDIEEARTIEEDDAMLGATFARPLDEDVPQAGDEALERIGVVVAEAYAELKRVRHDTVRARRERVRMVKRMTELESSKMPSFELSAQWGRRMRARSVADGTELLLADNGDVEPSASLLLPDEVEPPASLFLPDESAVMAELAATKDRQNGDEPMMTSFISPDALRDSTSAARELARLAGLVTQKDRRLRAAEVSLQKIEDVNHELVAKLDRAYADRIRAQQESGTAALRASARSASRGNTPNRGTDWDDLESIVQELERCKSKNATYFTNVERLCAVLNQHTLDRALSDAGDDDDAANRRQSSAPLENTYRKLLVDMATALDATGDLDARKSIRDNFSDMAAAVRRRLDEADSELRQTRSALDVSRLASEASPDAVQRARAAERRAGELETQLAEQHAQQAGDQATLRSLNSTIARLRQQCVAAEADVQEARLERDGWNQQFVACDRALQYQLSENERLGLQLRELSRQRTRDTQEFVLSRGDQSASINWDQITQEVTARVHRDAEATWNAREFALRQTYESQIKVFRWAARMWSSVVRTIASHYMRDQPKSGTTRAAGRCDSLCRSIDELEAQVDAAAKQAAALQDGLDGTRSRNEFVEMLALIVKGLELEFTSAWRDKVRSCIITLASSTGVTTSSPSGSSSSSASTGEPRLTATQKQLIREKYAKRESKIRDKFTESLRLQREAGERRVAEAESRFAPLVSECRYLRMRMAGAAERVRFVEYQKRVLMQVVGGQDGVFRLVDAMPESESNAQLLRRERVRRRWRLVLLAVHMKNQLVDMVAHTQRASGIKMKELVRMNSKNGQKTQPNVQRAVDVPPVASTGENGKLLGRGVFYNYRFQPHQFIGLKSTPITPSRLRNRTSDIASSNGSSL
ncbi:hypothetical protein IWW56_002152 [Coemansia sp. RSA 2131]|nr:hypothetical protein IWW56_002152 [Coemansia sp. RSA 2131]